MITSYCAAVIILDVHKGRTRDTNLKRRNDRTHLLAGAKAEAEATRAATIRTCFIIFVQFVGIYVYIIEVVKLY